MTWKWYGVKTVVRWEAFGKPTVIDNNYDETATYVEERVVLIKARNFNEAIKKGEKEVNDYLDEFPNLYGQQVRLRYLQACDAFELFEEPNQNGIEVYSSIECVGKRIKDSVIIDNKFGTDEAKSFEKKRLKFWDADVLEITEKGIGVRKGLLAETNPKKTK